MGTRFFKDTWRYTVEEGTLKLSFHYTIYKNGRVFDAEGGFLTRASAESAAKANLRNAQQKQRDRDERYGYDD